MNKWWNDMLVGQQIVFVLAVATSVFFLIQVIMLLTGIGGEEDSFTGDTAADAEAGDTINDEGLSEAAGINFLSVRSVLVFLCLGAWSMFSFMYILDWYFALLISIGVGALASVGYSYAMHAMLRLQNNGTLDPSNTVGKLGEVYLTLPQSRSGMGKVNVYVQERMAEFEAITDSEVPLKTGSQVKIKEVLGGGILLCEPLLLNENKEEK